MSTPLRFAGPDPAHLVSDRLEILTVSQMAAADRASVAEGVAGRTLMERAGAAVAAEALRLKPRALRVVVLAGPGANGGDGYVAARLIAEAGAGVTVFQLGRERLQGDAAAAAGDWRGQTRPLAELPTPGGAAVLERAEIVIDALFGAGLARPLEGESRAAVEALGRWRAGGRGRLIVAVDLPSGVSGDTGEVLGAAAPADLTVTFARKKPGHCLMPGRALCGVVEVAEIGVADRAVASVGARASQLAPPIWLRLWPKAQADGHKYARGHALVVCGGPWSTGAARLTARGALRIGAGLVTVATSEAAAPIVAAHLTAIMLAPCDDAAALAARLADARFTVAALGPGGGVGEPMRGMVGAALASGAAVVLDADALTSFEGRLDELAGLVTGRAAPVVLTPHEGEFRRLFGALPGGKLERARTAAARSGALVVLKGPDTVVATPDGRAALLDFDAPYLATAGSGDVLAGFVAGLLAQRVPAFEAACAAVWLHATLGARLGPGMIAEDLPDALPGLLREVVA